MLKLRNSAFISMVLLLISACGAGEETKSTKSTQTANINAGVKRVEEQAVQQQGMEQKQETGALADTSADTAAELVAQASPSAGTETEPGAETRTDAQPTPERTSIHTIVMLNKYGQVAFNHAAHTQFISCGTCHPTEPPTRIDKNRKEFHALCRTCHQESGAGPIRCSGCHTH